MGIRRIVIPVIVTLGVVASILAGSAASVATQASPPHAVVNTYYQT
jgi:hypothetical protein